MYIHYESDLYAFDITEGDSKLNNFLLFTFF